MMSGRPGREPLKFLPDEARSLPPPKLTDPRLLYFGFMGYCSGLLDNALRRRPVTMADGLIEEETRLQPETKEGKEDPRHDLEKWLLAIVW